MKKTTSKSRINAAAIARKARAIKDGELSVQSRLRIPSEMAASWTAQGSDDRGQTWADGIRVQRELGLLYYAIAKLNNSPLPSWIVDGDGVTVVMGDRSATGATQVDAAIKLLREVLHGGSHGQEKD